MDCHIEIFHENRWVEAAQVAFPDVIRQGFRASGCLFEYDLHYAFGDCPAISLAMPVDAALHQLAGWPPFLGDLIPQGNGRKFLLFQLQLANTQASDLPLLCAGAFNPIGHLRIREAVQYFAHHVERHGLDTEGFDFDALLVRAPHFHDTMMVHGMLAAGGTGVQGVAPKYLLTVGTDGRWYPDAALADERASAHFIVKRPRGASERDLKVLRNEAAYMAVARRCGIRTFDLPTLHGDMLFIPRFDRKVNQQRVIRLHQESLASIAEVAGFGVSVGQFALLRALRRVVSDPVGETIEFLCRDVLNLAMRNPDNHARNSAVQVADGIVRLTPLFDFAPMYLDPEGIVRAERWYHPESRKELLHWADVLTTLALPQAEHRQVVLAMAAFGEQLAHLPDYMREAGVDSDIIDFLAPSVEAQCAQLLALRQS